MIVSLEFTKTDKTALASDNSQILFCNARIYNAGYSKRTCSFCLTLMSLINKKEKERVTPKFGAVFQYYNPIITKKRNTLKAHILHPDNQ